MGVGPEQAGEKQPAPRIGEELAQVGRPEDRNPPAGSEPFGHEAGLLDVDAGPLDRHREDQKRRQPTEGLLVTGRPEDGVEGPGISQPGRQQLRL